MNCTYNWLKTRLFMHTEKKNVKPCIITLIASELCGTREEKNKLHDWIKLTKKK